MCPLIGMGASISTVRAVSAKPCTFPKTESKPENLCMTTPSLHLSLDLPDAESVIPSGLVCDRARVILLALGFDYVSEERGQLLFVQQYDSRREETVRNMRVILERGATIDQVREAIHDSGWHAHKEHVTRAREAYLTALKAPPEIRQIGPLPSQYGPNILAATMPAKS